MTKNIAHTHLNVCGPQGFMDRVIDTAEAAGHASHNVHRDQFLTDEEREDGDQMCVCCLAPRGQTPCWRFEA